jgi:hypothetical protein
MLRHNNVTVNNEAISIQHKYFHFGNENFKISVLHMYESWNYTVNIDHTFLYPRNFFNKFLFY